MDYRSRLEDRSYLKKGGFILASIILSCLALFCLLSTTFGIWHSPVSKSHRVLKLETKKYSDFIVATVDGERNDIAFLTQQQHRPGSTTTTTAMTTVKNNSSIDLFTTLPTAIIIDYIIPFFCNPVVGGGTKITTEPEIPPMFFSSYISKVMQQVHPGISVGNDAQIIGNNYCTVIMRRILAKAVEINTHNRMEYKTSTDNKDEDECDSLTDYQLSHVYELFQYDVSKEEKVTFLVENLDIESEEETKQAPFILSKTCLNIQDIKDSKLLSSVASSSSSTSVHTKSDSV